jgi:hypothetical protein
MECPNCKLINPPGAQQCDCGYSFVGGSGPSAKATVGQRVRIAWFFSWRVGLVSVLGAIIGYFIGYALQHAIGPNPDIMTALLALAAMGLFLILVVFVAACTNRWFIRLLLQKQFRGFRLNLRRNSSGPQNAVTLREALAVWWLMLWRVNATAFLLSFVAGFVFGRLPPWVAWCSWFLGVCWGNLWAIGVTIRKQFKTFRFFLVADD